MTTRTELSAVSPWGAFDRLVIAVGYGLGFGVIAVGWFGSSGEQTLNDQLGWVALGAVGAVVAAAAGAMWLLAGRRSVGIRCSRVLPKPRVPQATVVELGVVLHSAQPAPSERLMATGDMRYYHRSSCLLVRGKEARSAERAEHSERDRRPCGVCSP